MEQSIRDQIKDNPSTVTELILETNKTRSLSEQCKALIESCIKLEVISFNSVNLTSLDNFPRVETLRMLELADNSLDSNLQTITFCFRNLLTLNVSSNKINDLKELQKLEGLKQLVSLDLSDNPVAKGEEYSKVKAWAFGAFENLRSLDGKDADGKDVYDSW
mmetsp:Transcript_117529/g.252639  ORF Transcript_117529/g.252639 Transcript_117529/m.252639 type:complete len:162 (+) Transcript_117529:15-500(+)